MSPPSGQKGGKKMKDDYAEKIKSELYEREFRLKFVFHSQLAQLFAPLGKSCPTEIIRAIEIVIKEIFDNTYLSGPTEESYPDMKITREYDKAYKTIRNYMADIPYMPR